MLKIGYKILLRVAFCVTVAPEVLAATNFTCAISPSCADYGYTYRTTDCHLGFVGCPFNTALVKCDEEGAKDDFKYTLTPTEANGWTAASSTYIDRFIVGAYKSGETKKYCGVNGSGATLVQRYKSHTHPNGIANTDVTEGTRVGATGSKISVWLKASYYADYIFGTTSSTVGNGTGGSDLYPVHKIVRGYFYDGGGTSSPDLAVDIDCNQRPSCEELGYVDMVSNCPGTYVACPFDRTKVKCDLQAQAGEIKFSLQSKDHDGWLLCDGRTLSSKGTAYGKSELADKLVKNNMSTLPDYRAAFLRVSSSASNALVKDNLPNHKHSMQFSKYTQKTEAHSVNTGSKSTSWQYTAVDSPVKRDTPTTTVENTDGGVETVPPYYAANVFIYSGRLNVEN